MTFTAALLLLAAAIPGPLQQAGIDQKLNEKIPLDLEFKNESGATVRLGQHFGKRPVILTPVYFQCPMLCTLVLNDTLRAMRAMPLKIGRDYDVVTVSFNPLETPELAAAKKQAYLESLRREGGAAGWHFLTGREPEIHQLMSAIGFRYTRDPKTGQYAHASGIMVLTPEGRLARYFCGLEYSPRDLKLALVEASHGRIGSPVDQVLLFCFHYNATAGKYTLAVENTLRVAGAATVAGLFALIVVLRRRV